MQNQALNPDIEKNLSSFAKRLQGVGRILEDPDNNVWGCSPIYDEDGNVHVFYSKWVNESAHEGWLTCSQIGHAIASHPEGPYEVQDTALIGRGGDYWDSMTIHNPTIHKIGDLYYLFYMGNSDGTVATKRVGVAVSDSLYGPWERFDAPLIDVGSDEDDAWDSLVTSNPAFLLTPDGESRLYYKGWNLKDWQSDLGEGFSPRATGKGPCANRAYGLATAKLPTGPYTKYEGNPIINMRTRLPDAQTEDAYIWQEDGLYKVILRDMGFYNHEYGLYLESEDGLNWNQHPQIGYLNSQVYLPEPPNGLGREGRFERPQLLMKDGKPEYLFCAIVGGKYNTSSGAVLKIT
ncbi:glycoside hydrolase family protein [Rubellicoccus peritrichatus]|uniref:Glycoside hydrolase family protein n=1 Tax=Rubellicoccus peritrichatus TaxID=3080537 RepID=A0AAQ3LH09_9BACT|nr:glycoside hydrolase family protein [Puniceicoccus sp. CR14]WOO43720.1 glycoside hydrolase family protein [Puniceicoccus sp. CR14]